MKNIKEEAFIWVQLCALVAIWAAILYLTNTELAINWEALKKLPDVVTVYVILLFIFTKWLWRLGIFQGWLVPFPDLQGTWEGEIMSTWQGSEAAIPVVLVIRRTFSSISCIVFSSEMDSFSTAAQVTRDDDSGQLRLTYNYTSRPKATVRDRSAIHDGAAMLRIIKTPERRLEGEYWTSRRTTGDVVLKFRSKKLLEKFPPR